MGQKSIGLFGSSFNPPTYKGGHFSIVEFFCSYFDEIWVLPVYKHAFPTKHCLAPFETRLKLAALTFKELENVQVKAYEKDAFEAFVGSAAPDERADRFGTIDMVEYLQSTFPSLKFTWILGSDTFDDLKLGKWKRGSELLQLVDFALVQREGYDLQPNELGPRVKLYHVSLRQMSSTQARLCKEKSSLLELVHPDVAEVIENEKLYGFGGTE